MQKLLVFFSVSLIASQVLSAQSIDITVSKDCSCHSSFPNENWDGLEESLWVFNDETENIHIVTLLYFYLSDIPTKATITSANLNIYCVNEFSGDVTLRIARLEDKYWSETEPTFNNMPIMETPPEAKYFPITPSSWNNYNVTEFVEAWHKGTINNRGFQLFTQSDGPFAQFYGQGYLNGTYAPKLTISYTVPY